MKTAEKLHKAFQMFRPHINGHNTAIKLFLEAANEVEKMESTPAPSIKGMRWVKASEVKPSVKYRELPFRLAHPQYPTYKIGSVMAYAGQVHPDEMFVDDSGDLWPFDQVEYLSDETPSLPSSPNKGYTKDLSTEEKQELIKKHIGGMWGGLEMASIDYFKQTGTINGSFNLRLIALMKFYKWKLDELFIASLPNGSSKEEGWIAVEDGLPDFDKDILVIGKMDWKKEPDNIICFVDKLTRQEETLEYGQSAYLLENKSDFLVSQNPLISEVCQEYVTHWRYLPSHPLPKINREIN